MHMGPHIADCNHSCVYTQRIIYESSMEMRNVRVSSQFWYLKKYRMFVLVGMFSKDLSRDLKVKTSC